MVVGLSGESGKSISCQDAVGFGVIQATLPCGLLFFFFF